MLEDAQAWRFLQDEYIPRARARFPDEPRWRLAAARALAATKEPAPLVWPGDKGRPDALRNREVTVPADLSKLADAERAFVPLVSTPEVAGEAELYLGYLELRRRQWVTALAHFDRARPMVAGPLLPAVTDYFAGWVNERSGRRLDAIAAYRRAHALEPHMRNLSTLLAAQLFLVGQRTEAYQLLEVNLPVSPDPIDLLVLYQHGDGWMMPDLIHRMREALR
jgi:tetratricopeptide (TPR) repeat protein